VSALRSATVEAVLWAALLWVLYLVLISTVTTSECVVGAVAAVLGGAFATALRRAARHWPTGPVRGLGRALALWPMTLATDLAGLCAALLPGRGPGGAGFRTLRMGERAAWGSALLSATPGSYVVAVEPDGTALVHALLPRRSALEQALDEPSGASEPSGESGGGR